MSPSYKPVSSNLHRYENNGDRFKQKLYPFSLILISLWVAFTVMLLWLLERAVTHGPESIDPPWTLTTLPSVLLTVFAQAHVPITGIHLARIAVSALQYPGSTPNSWTELFWLADQEWLGPIGIVKTTFKSIYSRTRASFTFILFATTCAIALITPVIMTKAYDVRQVRLMEDAKIRPSTTTFSKMQHVEGYTQMGVGMGSWGTGTSVADVYNTSLFVPQDQPRNASIQPREFFFAGDINNATATLPGLHLKGDCSPIDIGSSGLDITSMKNQSAHVSPSWQKFCQSRLPHFNGESPGSLQEFTGLAGLSDLSLNLCNNRSWSFAFDSELKTQSQNMGYVYYQYALPSGTTGIGLIQCNSTLTTGTALISGLDRTYTNFTPQTLYNFSDSTGGEPLLDPMYSFHYMMGQSETRTSSFQSGVVTRGFDFQFRADGGPGGTSRTFPSPDDMSESLWGGIAHFTSAVAVLSRDTNLTFDARVPRQVALYTRNRPYACSTFVLLALWLIIIAGITAWSYRRTFSGSLNSYVAAELIFREKFLLENVPIGEADDNDKLNTPFRALQG